MIAELWLTMAVTKGIWLHCYYSETRPTVMQPYPPVYLVRAVPRIDGAELAEVCPLKMYETNTLPEDAA